MHYQLSSTNNDQNGRMKSLKSSSPISVGYLNISKFVAGMVLLSVFLMVTFLKSTDFYNPLKFYQHYENLNYNITVEIINPNYPNGIESVKRKMLPWDLVVEPYQRHIVSISSLVVDGQKINVSEFEILWRIGEDINYGQNFDLIVTKTGKIPSSIELSEINSYFKNKVTYKYSFDIMAKYIRREIRSLKDEDLQIFFDALFKTYTVNETYGKELYGPKFRTAEQLNYKHLTGAGTTDCDHWHDGAGIVTHHMAFTLEAEQALQAINPSIAMPYWEYGMDAYLYSDWMTSPVFNDDWFGEANPSSSDHSISRGFWSTIKTPNGGPYKHWDISNTGTLNPYVNGYGQMRTPWNNNPSLGIGRHNYTYEKQVYSIPSCSLFYDCFSENSIANVFSCANGGTHGPVHIMIGGTWEKTEDFLYNDTYSSMQTPFKVLIFKVLWRKGYTRCPSTCPTDGSACKCSVPQEYIDRFGARAMLEDINYSEDNVTDAYLLGLLRVLEDPGIAGDMYSSSASFDPTFWPLHGALERLVDLKRILVADGNYSYFNLTWNYPYYSDTYLYLFGVCDWSGVKGSEDLTLPLCDSEASCSGHGAGDVMEFGNFLNQGETYTNVEFFDFIHPWNEDLPYTYDTFDYDYCLTNEGYDFS